MTIDRTALNLINSAERINGQMHVESATPETHATLADRSHYICRNADGTRYTGYSVQGRPNPTWTIVVTAG